MKSHFKSRGLDTDDQDLINQYLRKGGTVTDCPAGQRTEELEYNSGFYQKHRRKEGLNKD